MSRFFKSAAFPILIVVVLAFFAQKLISEEEAIGLHDVTYRLKDAWDKLPVFRQVLNMSPKVVSSAPAR